MPYITQERRKYFDMKIFDILETLEAVEVTAGDMNYIITRILTGAYKLTTAPRYDKINTCVGILDCVKLELYRRIASPYEDIKIEENGDV